MFEIARELDCRGHRCPIPVLRTRKYLAMLQQGDILKVIATDPNSWVDLPQFCVETGHELLEQEASTQRDQFSFLIRKR